MSGRNRDDRLLGRRQAIKTLLAGSGALVAASSLPPGWTPAVITVKAHGTTTTGIPTTTTTGIPTTTTGIPTTTTTVPPTTTTAVPPTTTTAVPPTTTTPIPVELYRFEID